MRCLIFNKVMLAYKLKQLNGKRILVIGGIHPTIRPNEVLNSFDVALRGESEQTILKLADSIANDTRIEDLQFPTISTKYFNSSSVGLVEDIDTIPPPDFTDNFILKGGNFFCEKDYAPIFGKKYRILTSRGCPFACTFCTNNVYSNLKMSSKSFSRKRSIYKIIEELSFAKEKYKIEDVAFCSDNFLATSDQKFEEFIFHYKKKLIYLSVVLLRQILSTNIE